jgi:protein-disulfide isomerase
VNDILKIEMELMRIFSIIITGLLFSCFAQSNCPQALSLRIEECNNETIDTLVHKGNRCDMANRLNSFARRLESLAIPCSTMVEEVKIRYMGYKDTIGFRIDTSGLVFEGAADAPVKIVAYVSMSCPLCKRLYRDLTDSLKSNNRSGKIAIAVKPFSTSLLDRALVAAQKWKKQGKILRALAPIKDRLTMETIMHIADSLHIPLAAFKKEIENDCTRSIAEMSRVEAVLNGVTVTPTFFINGKRYRGYKDARWVLDAAEYESLKKR